MSIFNKLSFVKKQHENNDVYTFYFTRPKGMNYKAGQHGIFLLGLRRPHPFSVSSAPDEEYVTITTHTDRKSRFKHRLMELKVGDSITVVGPVMNFAFRNDGRRNVFLAQGVGITPFRSMLVHAHTRLPGNEVTLVHVDGAEHLFRGVTQEYATKSFYPTNPDEFRDAVTRLDNDQWYFLSGSPKYIAATKELLVKKGVNPSDIVTDSFLGY